MPFLLQPFHLMLVVLSEYVRREQEKQIEYLREESQILREKIGGNRVLLTDDQRRRVAAKGKVLGRRQLEEVAIIAQADTILRWHRELIENPEQRSNTRSRSGATTHRSRSCRPGSSHGQGERDMGLQENSGPVEQRGISDRQKLSR